jgi:type IV secretory pathway VirB6-like protein
MNWHFFSTLNDGITTPIIAQMQSMLGGVCTAMQPLVLAMLVVWFGFVGFDIANKTKSVEAAIRDAFIAAMIVGALNTAQYTQYVSDLFLQAIPTSISAVFGGSGSPVNGLDALLGQSMSVADQTYGALPDSWKAIPLCMAVVLYMIVSAVSIGYAFLVLMVAAIVNVVAIVIGPVFLALGAIPLTRRFAAGWFSVLVGGCVTQLMALAVIQLLSTAEGTMLQQVGHTIVTNSDTIAMLWGLLQCGMLLALGAAVVKKIPSIAREISGGVYHGAAGVHAATFGAAAAAGGAAYAGAKRGVGAVAAAASGVRSSSSSVSRRPTGPSLSSRRP